MRHIDYIPKPELYDLCLAKLMDRYGGADISREEALSVLTKNLCDATEIQNGYDKEIGQYYGKTSLKGEKPKLAKAVLDRERKRDAWNALRFSSSKTQGISFKEHDEKGQLIFWEKEIIRTPTETSLPAFSSPKVFRRKGGKGFLT